MDNKNHESPASLVEILLTEKLRIEIEAIYLRACSKYFATSLDKLWMERCGLSAEEHIRPIFKLVLDTDPLGDFLLLQPHAGVPPVPDLNLSENRHRDDAYYRAFQNLFDVFKHQAPQLASLGDVQALVDLADKYDSLPAVSQAVRLHLMESRGKPAELYLQIAKEPRIFLSIGEKIRSSIIVKEAAIHIIGTWSVTEKPCQDLVSDRLFDALAKAADALRRKQERANTLLLSLDYEPPIPVMPNNLYQASSALIMLRDRIGKAFSRCYQQHQPELCQGMPYREIATIPHFDKLRIPSPYYPATIESHKVSFEDGCSQLKDKIQLALGDLAQCYARVTPAEIGSNYLMCGRLDDADLPWKGEGY